MSANQGLHQIIQVHVFQNLLAAKSHRNAAGSNLVLKNKYDVSVRGMHLYNIYEKKEIQWQRAKGKGALQNLWIYFVKITF